VRDKNPVFMIFQPCFLLIDMDFIEKFQDHISKLKRPSTSRTVSICLLQ